MSEPLKEVTVKVADRVSDGKGGFIEAGEKVKVPAASVQSLKDKGLI